MIAKPKLKSIKKPDKKKIIKENDTIASLIARIRDNFICQICGKYSKHTEAMHIFGCGWKNTRWDTRNLITGCYYCHRFRMHGGKLSEDEKKQKWINLIGEGMYNELYEKSRKVVKFDLSFVLMWNSILRSEFLQLKGMTYEQYLKEKKEAKE